MENYHEKKNLGHIIPISSHNLLNIRSNQI
jgi:hypothetical protein